MKHAGFVEHIPEVVPHLVAISEVDEDSLRQLGPVFRYEDGRREETGHWIGNMEILRGTFDPKVDFIVGNPLTFIRRDLENRLGALLRISEEGVDSYRGNVREDLGAMALAVTNRTADVGSRIGPLIRSGDSLVAVPEDPHRFDPAVQIPKHREHYAAIMGHLRKPLRKQLQGYLFA